MPGTLTATVTNLREVNHQFRIHAQDMLRFTCRMSGIQLLERSDGPPPGTPNLFVTVVDNPMQPKELPSRADDALLVIEYERLIPPSGEPRTVVADWYSSRDRSHWPSNRGESITDWLQKLLAPFVNELPGIPNWYGSSERLLGQLDNLLAERDRLLRQLESAYQDLDVAEARIRQLEAARDQLRDERYGVKAWTTPAMIVAIATFIVTLLPTVLVLADDDADTGTTNNIQNTTIIAQDVIQDCSADVHVQMPLPPTPAPPPPTIPESR